MLANDLTRDELIACLVWQVACGADEALDDEATHDRAFVSMKSFLAEAFAVLSPVSDVSPGPVRQTAPLKNLAQQSSTPAIDQKVDELTTINSLDELRSALENLEGCSIRNTAGNLVFCDGNPGARLMIVGEAPGRDEDRIGLPFVGAAGQLLDKMLASIGLDRSSVYITNLLPWRPPGNRAPTAEEVRLLLPYLRRHIQLAKPEILLILGGSSAKALLGTKDGILKLRGVWRDVDFGDGVSRPTLASLHPAYLLRSPAQKRLCFDDLLSLHARLT